MTHRAYVQGLLQASVVVAQAIGGIKIGELNEQTWNVVNGIQAELLRLAGEAAENVEKSR